MDSNHRRHTPADLQSAPFGHSGIFPICCPVPKTAVRLEVCPDHRPRFRADGGIRTPDQLITNQLLWPTELHRHFYRFGLQKYELFFYPQNFCWKFAFCFQCSLKERSIYVPVCHARHSGEMEIGCKDNNNKQSAKPYRHFFCNISHILFAHP